MSSERWDVLVLDDEKVICQAVKRILEHEGLTVATVNDCDGALAHPAAAHCRLAVCDIVLPDGSGVDVIRELKRRRPDLPVLVITGYATPQQENAAMEAGAARFLAKPFEQSELLEAVRDALGSAAATDREGRS